VRTRLVAVALLIVPLAACRSCACQGEPAGATRLANEMRIPVEIDGTPALVIDRELLDRVTPDFVEADRKAWRLQTLLGPKRLGPQATIEVDDSQGARVVLARPEDLSAGREPLLTVNREGDLRMALGRTDDEEVFAAFHGRGGNRARGGEPGRVREVRHVWIRTNPPGQ
jgi:hypothetical protein